MPSSTIVSDASSTNATHGSVEPSGNDINTSSNGSTSSHYYVAETAEEKKKRQDELLIGFGSHLSKR
ncbi:hypothetical protein FPOAC2_07146 [Fusarium poae]